MIHKVPVLTCPFNTRDSHGYPTWSLSLAAIPVLKTAVPVLTNMSTNTDGDVGEDYSLLAKEETEVESNKEEYACSVCGMIFSLGDDFTVHYRVNHTITETGIDEVSVSDISVKGKAILLI